MLSSDAENTNDLWPEIPSRPTKLASPTRGRPRSRNLKNVISPAKMTIARLKRSDVSGKNSAVESPRSGGKKTRRSSKHGNVVNDLNDRRDEDDELTDRCCSPTIGAESPTRIGRTQRGQQRLTSHSQSPSLQLSPGRKNLPVGLGASVTVKPSPTKRTSSATPKRRSSPSSNLSSYSSPSTSDADSDSGFTNRRRTLTGKNGEEDRKFRSPTRNSLGTKEMKLSGTSGTMLRRPPFAPPLAGSNTSSGMGARLPSDASNLTAATELLYASRQWSNVSGVHDHTGSATTPTAAVLAAAASLAGSNHPLAGALGTVASGLLTASSSSASGVSSLPAHGVALPRSHLPPNKRAAAAATAAALSGTGNGLTATYDMMGHLYGHQISPRGLDPLPQSPKKVVHKGVQTASQSCPDCKEREAQRLAELEEHKRALQELEERLTEQFKEEQAAATQAALEQAQLSMREAVEREQKLALEASEARFAEVLVQTKRRQWCRNCLSEAIYHCCWNTSYCSIPCQQEHWQNEHKRQCRRKRMVSANMSLHSISPFETTDSTIFAGAKLLDKKPLLEDTLDIAPSGLRFCFDREHFLNDEFHSDEFILAHDRRGTSLEQMRDSLLQYSNILKSSLVELINQDYADFVNLSTNLVGLDKAIDIIASPLQELHQSVSDLLRSLHTIGECISRLERWLAPSSTDIRINGVHSKRGSVHFSSANGTPRAGLVGVQLGEEDEEAEADTDIAEWPVEFLADYSLHEDPGLKIDRIANEYVKLHFFTKKCQHHPIVQHMKPRIQWITSTLQELLAQRLRLALDTAQLTSATGADQSSWSKKTAGEQLRQALSTYLVIDKLYELAQLYRQYALRPQLSQVCVVCEFSPMYTALLRLLYAGHNCLRFI
ncbi:hypothetical protein P879_05917 [Paragonimus westermani]|uniref:Conserved oligomeric Golgi complex subunit 2 n=1 Tax=Paragonimus westermani TaxID=34504 RepID=A0A8T0DRB3_9TREM|nr:hypothetical protein P879_05917 [Paragonimus westermani]